MMQSVIERAYELAESGQCIALNEIEAVLSKEGFDQVYVHMRSPSLRKDLARLLNKSDDENPD